jgi:hypothetical protein
MHFFIFFTQTVWSLFFILFIFFFPAYEWELHSKFVQFCFDDLIYFSANKILHCTLLSTAISSDSLAMYVFTWIVVVISIVLATLKFFRHIAILPNIAYNIITIYLFFQMFQYGWHKVTMQQFYIPEPNILYQQFGSMPQDILYWSVIGTNRAYNFFLGGAEILIALLLIVPRTGKLATGLCMLLLVHIIVINLCFDINVKLFSIMLCCMAIFNYYLLKFEAQKIVPINKLIKSIIIFFIIVTIIFPNVVANNYNENKLAKPLFYGAYKVTENEKIKFPKYIFIHKDNYLILQWHADSVTSLAIYTDTITKQFFVRDNVNQKIKFSYHNNSLLQIIIQKDTLHLTPMQWQKLPALQQSFHWMIEDYKSH